MSKAIRVSAWAIVLAGVATPLLRHRLRLRPRTVLAAAGAAPLALTVAMPRSRLRDVVLCTLNMWAYTAAYKLPNDDPDGLEARVKVRYPIVIDRVLGFGALPTERLQHRFARPGRVRGVERVLAWCHWAWFAIPHAAVIYVWLRRPDRFAAAAARTYAVFDVGAVIYWALPTAPPWWAAAHGYLGEGDPPAVRRIVPVDHHLPPVIAVEPIPGPDPHKSPAVLTDRLDGTVGQPLFTR